MVQSFYMQATHRPVAIVLCSRGIQTGNSQPSKHANLPSSRCNFADVAIIAVVSYMYATSGNVWWLIAWTCNGVGDQEPCTQSPKTLIQGTVFPPTYLKQGGPLSLL